MPPRQKTARPTTAKLALVPAQEKLSKAVDTAAGLRKTLRDTVCVEPKYPGAPSDYRYLPHRCVRKGDAAAVPKKPKALISEADTRKEIKILREVIDAHGEGYNDFQIDGNNITDMITMFKAMMKTSIRKKFPDPIKRYEFCHDRMTKVAYAHDQSKIYIPRYTVLNLVMSALESTL